MSQTNFEADFPSTFCAWAEECTATSAAEDGDPLEATCEDAMIVTLEAYAGDSSCTYDADLADKCFDAMETTSCDDYETVVDACNAVYTGSSCNLTLGDYL